MKAHIVGGGFGGLAAAALLIRNANAPGQDITIYEADGELGGGYFLDGSAASGYNLPGSVFDKEFRCGFELLATIPTLTDPNLSVRDQFFTFNDANPFNDQAHILDRDLRHRAWAAFRPELFGRLALLRVSADARSDARRAAHRGVLFRRLLQDRILAALVDDHGVAAAAQRDRVPALHEPLPLLVPRPVDHGGGDAHALQPARSVRQTSGRLAHVARRELHDRRLRAKT